MERIKEYLKDKPWLIGILIALPVVFVIWLLSRRKQAGGEQYEPAGMIYQPPAGGGAVSTESTDTGAETTTLLTSFLEGLTKQQEAQRTEMQEFLKAQAEAQKAFMEQLAGQQSALEKSLSAFLQSINQPKPQPVIMPVVPEVPKREIYFSPEKSFSIPKGIVSVADMPGKTEDEKWAQFEQTIAYDYFGRTAREAQSRIRELQAQWGAASSEEERNRIHQLAQAERQRVYQEITRGGAGFTATWKDTGVGYQELEVKTPKGEVIRL